MHHAIRIFATTSALAALLGACTTNDPINGAGTPVDPATALGTVYDVESRNHTDGDIDYAQSPPVGGDHHQAWQNCKVYGTAIADEDAVHSLEHGAVWLTYDPVTDPGAASALDRLAQGQTHVLVSPYPGQGDAVVATAWGVQQRFEAVDETALSEFITTYQQGPQTPEPGAVCSGALDEPA